MSAGAAVYALAAALINFERELPKVPAEALDSVIEQLAETRERVEAEQGRPGQRDRPMSDDLSHLCGASMTAAPGYTFGPCVLRVAHDGPLHMASDGSQWVPATPPEVADLRRRAVRVLAQAWPITAKVDTLNAEGHRGRLQGIADAVLAPVQAKLDRLEQAEAERDRYLDAVGEVWRVLATRTFRVGPGEVEVVLAEVVRGILDLAARTCPNTPPCPHPGSAHDGDAPVCCATGCACGEPADASGAVP